MRKPFLPKSTRAAALVALLLVAPVPLWLHGCTDLDESPTSSITPENFYRSEPEVLGGLASVYASLRGTLDAWWNVTQVSSDETIVPTRGQDWYDNGRWLELDRQLWGANSVSGLEDVNGAWNNLFTGIARANVVLAALENVNVTDKATVQAELRTLRAFFYYLLMDMFGGVPIVTTTEIAQRPRNTRKEVFDFIETELTEVRAALPDRWPAEGWGRMTRGATDAILASMYLNAGVFTRDDGISVTAYNSCQGVPVTGGNACEAAITAADRILNSGTYALATDWRSNFTASNHSSRENILVIRHLAQDGLGLNFVMRALHYNQFNPAPWNGFSTIADVYNSFDQDDRRRQIFLVGPQVNVETGQPVTDRQGNNLVFVPDIPDPTQATEAQGVRILKFPADPAHVAQHNANDFTHFRLAEIYLIKAEALNELGRLADAVLLVNTLRARAFDPPKPLNAASFNQASFRDQILKERLFELANEGKRRQDLIRHARFTQAWGPTLANGSLWKQPREPFRVLMPIPQSQLDTNPQLTQNPGY
jgi:hypothetical protein